MFSYLLYSKASLAGPPSLLPCGPRDLFNFISIYALSVILGSNHIASLTVFTWALHCLLQNFCLCSLSLKNPLFQSLLTHIISVLLGPIQVLFFWFLQETVINLSVFWDSKAFYPAFSDTNTYMCVDLYI